MRLNSRPLANQREFQLRETESRKPVGLIFWPMMVLLVFAVADRDVDVAALLADPRAAPLGARPQAAQRPPPLHENAPDLALLPLGAVALLALPNPPFPAPSDPPP